MADTLARFLFMARPCGVCVKCTLQRNGCKNSNVSRETNGAYRGGRGVLKMFHYFTK